MPVNLARFAPMLRERSADIVGRVLAPCPEGPIRPDTPPEARAFWEMAGPMTVTAVAQFMDDGLTRSREESGAGVARMMSAGVTLTDCLAAKSAFCREIGRTVESCGGDVTAVLAAVEAADRVIGWAMDAFLAHIESSLSAERSGLLTSLEAFDVVVFRADLDSRLLAVNRAGAAVLGAASPSEVIGRRFAEFYADEAERERLRALLAENGEVRQFRFRLRRLDGQVRWCETNLRRIVDSSGRPVGLEGFGRDISGLLETEGALKRTESRYRELVELANSIILRMDTEGRVTFLNEFGERFFGFRKDELVGRNVIGTIVPETESSGRDLKALILDIGRNPDRYALNENENLRRDGERVWISWTNRAIRDESGRITELLCVGSDSTTRRRAQEELRRSQELYRDLVENLNDAIYTVNEAGVITYCSPVIERMSGYRPEEIVGQPFSRFVHPDDMELVAREFGKGLAGDVEPSTFRIVAKDGTARWARTSTRPEIVDGRAVGLHGLLADVTALFEAEEARKRTAQLLDKLPICAFEIGQDNRIATISAGGLRMVGAAEPAQVVGRPVTDFYATPSQEPDLRARVAADERGAVMRMQVRRLDGTTFWAEGFARTVRNAAGEAMGREGFLRDISALVEAEHALEAERGRLDQVVRSVGAGLCLVDRDLRIVWANDLLARTFGPLDKMAGCLCHRIFARSESACRECPALRTFQDGGQHVADMPVPASDGGQRIIRLTTSPVRDADGRVVQVLELTQDVTEERAAEGERARTASLLSGILSSAGEYAIVATDAGGTINYFSEGAERLFGVRQSGPVGRLNVADLWPPESRAALAAALEDLGRGGRYEDDAELLRAQGLTFTARVSGTSRHDGDGTLAGYTFVIREVTEERAAQKLVTLLAHAVESSREGMALTDMSGVVTYVNPAIAALTGREASELLGKDVSIMYSKETPGEEIRAIARSTLAGGWSGEVTGVRADGSTYPAYMTTSLVRDEHGRAVAMVGLWRDVSREKSLQRRLFEQEQRHLAELERQVRERTAELERAYRDLQKLDAMKDRFLTNVSHELRTPLVSGVGYIELILHEGLGPINEDIRKGLRVAHRNLLRLVNLIDDLLTFTRLGSGKESMVVGRFDLEAMINDCLLDLKVRASKKALHVEMDVEKGLPPVEADEENIHRVLTNLLSNAEKFTGDEAVIRVQARRVSESRVEVRVSDDGVGIPPEELAQVFERFYRSHRTVSPRYGGTGIGLSLVREILEAHGCTVHAESPGERGTIVVFTLPLAASAARATRRAPAAAVSEPEPAPYGRGRTGASILVIDDDPDVHELLRSILKDSGNRLVSAQSGGEGLEAASSGDFDLIFLDLSMEDMDGTEVLARLRREERSRHTPVCMLTARADDGTLKDPRASGAQGVLAKPFSIAEVREAIDEFMSGGDSDRPSGRLPRAT